jgi:hypothetical protein
MAMVVPANKEEITMPDNKNKVGQPDRSRVSADQDYEVRQLVEKHSLSEQQARDLIARIGNDRKKLDQAAEELKTSSQP